VTAKQNDYKALPGKLGSPPDSPGQPGSRTGDGFLALFQGFAYALFQLFAKAAVLLAQVLLRVLLLAAPLIGLAAMLLPELLPKVAKAAGAVLFQRAAAVRVAGMHALLLNLIFGAQLSLLAQMLLASLITIVFFMIGRPIGGCGRWSSCPWRLRARRAVIARPVVRLRKKSNEPTPQEQFWAMSAVATAPPPASPDGCRVRPEASYGTRAARSTRPPANDRRNAARRNCTAPGAQPAAALPASRPTARPRSRCRKPPQPDRGQPARCGPRVDRGEDAFVVPSQVTRRTPRVAAETEMVAGGRSSCSTARPGLGSTDSIVGQ